jgi:chemotaxis protein methyltransferase CheR
MVDHDLDMIREYIAGRSRLSFTGHKKQMLRRRLEGRMTALGIADLAAYREHLLKTPAEERLLLDHLTTNETFFFRNPDQFRHLREVIIPAIEAARGQDVVRSWGQDRHIPSSAIMKLRILSAGCSTGEEPYSIAMTLLDALRYPKAWDIEIVAGDLSDSCLRSAVAGVYETDRLKGLPGALLDKYMDRVENGAVVREEVKSLVRFTSLNLGSVMDGGPLPGFGPPRELFDIIFCRNVMIYFSASSQQLLVDTLYRMLVPGGFLFTGDAEPLHLFDHAFETVRGAGCLIYKKMETTRNADTDCQ